MKKLIRTSLNNVANKRGVRDLNIQLYSHDKNNAGFEFVIKNEVDLSEYKAKVLFDFQETFATWETTGTIEGNVVKVKFDTTFITKCEEVIGYLFLDSETDTLDVFKFKFNVVLSEIDKYDMAKRGFRYIKDQEVVDVITRSELEEEIKKLQVNGGIDLSDYLTTSVASETYAKKTDLPAPYNDSALVERVTNLENKTPVDLTNYALKTEIPQPYNDSELVQKIGQLEARVDMDTVYDDTPLKQRVEVLETKVDKDTIYNDEEVKQRLTVLESKPAVDTSNFITTETLDSKNYLTTTVAEETYAKKSEIPQPYNDSVLLERVTNLENKTDKDTVYDDTNIKERLTNLENKPTVDASNFVTNETLEEKHYVTNEQISSTYATKSEIPQPYSDTELVKRITVLENKQDNDTVYDDAELKRRVTALEERPTTGGSVDTSDFVTKKELKEKEDAIYDAMAISPLYKLYTEETITEHLNSEDSLVSNGVDIRGGIIYSNSPNATPYIFKGDLGKEKFVDFNLAMFTVANSIPDNYSMNDLMYGRGEDKKVLFLSNKNFAEAVPKEELKAIIKEVLTELKSENN